MINDMQARRAEPRDKLYRISDSRGLCLEIKPNGSKLWRFRYQFAGTAKMISLGAYPEVSLSKARERTEDARRLVAGGSDPSTSRKVERASLAVSFEDAAAAWHEFRKNSLDIKNEEEVWEKMRKHILPPLGKYSIGKITPPEVLAVLRRIEEQGKRETARRLLGWCGQIFRFAIAHGQTDSNPCRDLLGALAKPNRKHFAAIIDEDGARAYYKTIKAYHGGVVVRAALMLGVLTFVRPGNIAEAEWRETDLDGGMWTIPEAKMKVKGRGDFVVPLSRQAVELLRDLHQYTGQGEFLFPGALTGSRTMSHCTMRVAQRRLGYDKNKMTPHGVRAMARTICHEVLEFSPEVLEEQLAHGKAGPLRDAYDRTKHIPERKRLMQAWADWIEDIQSVDEDLSGLYPGM